MGNNVEYVLGHLLFLNGREIEGFIKEHVFAIHVANRKIFAKFVLLICNLDYRWM
jgi:hypothetical protein